MAKCFGRDVYGARRQLQKALVREADGGKNRAFNALGLVSGSQASRAGLAMGGAVAAAIRQRLGCGGDFECSEELTEVLDHRARDTHIEKRVVWLEEAGYSNALDF